MNKVLGVLMIQLFFLSPCWANQVKTILPDETIQVSISSQHLNRIKILQDKIIQVMGHEGEYQFKTDAGELFIQSQLNKPLTIFITTEKQQTYGLVLVPKSGLGSQTIILQAPNDKKPASLKDAVEFLKTLEQKPVAHQNDEIKFEPSGFNHLDWRLVESVKQTEQSLMGNIFEIKNKTSKKIVLASKEVNFASLNTMIIQFQNIELNPEQTTLLYQVNYVS